MQQHRILSLLSILVMVIIPLAGWFLVAQPQLDAAAQADQQRTETEGQTQASAAVVAQLKADSAKLPELNDDLNELRTSIPAEVDSDGYIDGLDALAQVTGVVITGLTVDQPTAYVQADVPVPPAADPAATDAPVAPVVDPDVNPAIVTSPLITTDNFVAIPVTLELSGDWAPVLNFVDGLQTSPRLFLVTGLTTKLVEGSGTLLTAEVDGYIYAIPTGVEGKPRPISTVVKSMTAAVPEAPDPAATDEPDPDSTEPPAAP
jgi:Tfp pilus assembly protein PilO